MLTSSGLRAMQGTRFMATMLLATLGACFSGRTLEGVAHPIPRAAAVALSQCQPDTHGSQTPNSVLQDLRHPQARAVSLEET